MIFLLDEMFWQYGSFLLDEMFWQYGSFLLDAMFWQYGIFSFHFMSKAWFHKGNFVHLKYN